MLLEKWRWKKFGLTLKFSIVFALLLFLFILIGVTGYISYINIQTAEEKILTTKNITRHVLEMDRGMERAYRLHGDFFLHYQYIGLQEAHDLYALPSVKQVARVIKLSNELKHLLFETDPIHVNTNYEADVNLYLASAKRFADTSIEAVELVTRRSLPERGIEARLMSVCKSIQDNLSPYKSLLDQANRACSFYKDYLISRHRHLMQSSLNELSTLSVEIAEQTTLPADVNNAFLYDRNQYRMLSDALLTIDLAINGKFKDFQLQQETLTPISTTLVNLSRTAEIEAQKTIDQASRTSALIIPISTLLGIFIIIFLFRLVHASITKNVIRLTDVASEFSRGNLQTRVEKIGYDELGQLAVIFNNMAAHIADLINNLETKVVQRTSELALSEERFRQLVRELPNIAVQGYDENRIIRYWNRASEVLFGYSSDEALGKKIEDLIYPANIHDDLCQQITNWFDNNIPITASEIMLQHKNGSEVPVYAAYVMQANSDGVQTMYCVHVDLAELKRAQKGEQRSEFFYRQLFEQSSSAVAVYEPVDSGDNFIIKDINSAGEVLEGTKRDRLIGHTLTEVFPKSESEQLLELFRKVLKSGKPAFIPTIVYDDDQLRQWRENRVYRLPSGEIVMLYDDITTQKETETKNQAMELRLQRAQKMEAIGLMAGGIAHDLNNTLSAIIGYPDLLMLQLPEESQLRKPLTAIKQAGERASAVVADLLTVARGIATPQQEADINLLVQDFFQSEKMSKLQEEYPNILFEQYLAGDLPHIVCSSVHIMKCINHLAVNAVESINKCGKVIFATRIQIPNQSIINKFGLQPIPHSVLSISDTGPGMSTEDLEHIFEPFYTKRSMGRVSGTGLGLSVVWNIMEEHKGAVVVETDSKRTSFDLYFPTVPQKSIRHKNPEITLTDLRGNGEKILVVDDEPQQRELAKKVLEHYGYKVECQPSGEDAISYLKTHSVDLIILDMIMTPGISGRQTYELVTHMHPNQKAIIASGFSESEDIRETLRMGAGNFIKKPYSIKELASCVKSELLK
ncbi:hybrid sensor histidine kinase/response regulator [Desulfosediminicola flagellatus]|uniref:hybrid sensor histidine kinase/response regulator n=1 Tax=Desulfosediminicola flagellatus TaxID=2569541 RepID=UPI0010AC1CA8|nr:PAS domain-containing sensor histidine kinase [Desulfosediminicola flagellatus]